MAPSIVSAGSISRAPLLAIPLLLFFWQETQNGELFLGGSKRKAFLESAREQQSSNAIIVKSSQKRLDLDLLPEANATTTEGHQMLPEASANATEGSKTLNRKPENITLATSGNATSTPQVPGRDDEAVFGPTLTIEDYEEGSKTLIRKQENGTLAPSGNATFTVEAPVALVHDDEGVFDPTLSIEEYEAMPKHSPPTKEWLTSCARTLSNDTNIQQPWQLEQKGYRLGDCIRICKECVYRKPPIHNYTYNMAHAYYFWACEAQQSSNRTENFDVLDRIFAEWGARPGFEKPDPNALVVHLRLGDVIENTQKTAEELLVEGGIGFHPNSRRNKIRSIFSLYTYLDLLDKMGDNGPINKIYLVGGSHKEFHYKVSKAYAHCLQRGLAKAGKKVELWIDGRDPDQDFYFMSHAKRLVLSTGGFSMMMGRMVERKGGKVLGPATELAPGKSNSKGDGVDV